MYKKTSFLTCLRAFQTLFFPYLFDGEIICKLVFVHNNLGKTGVLFEKALFRLSFAFFQLFRKAQHKVPSAQLFVYISKRARVGAGTRSQNHNKTLFWLL